MFERFHDNFKFHNQLDKICVEHFMLVTLYYPHSGKGKAELQNQYADFAYCLRETKRYVVLLFQNIKTLETKRKSIIKKKSIGCITC